MHPVRESVVTPDGSLPEERSVLSKLCGDLLRRAPDANGQAIWQTALVDGASLEDVIVGVLMSDEYYNHGLYHTPPN